MRWILCCISMLACLGAVPMAGVDSKSPPTSRPTTSISIPYALTPTNHILIRVKINGKGPFNFIMDTGAPAMFLRNSAADKLGVTANEGGLATIDRLEIEGGAVMKKVQCVVETPYQIEGMNAIGASGVDLDGMIGYSVLARYRLQIDLSKDHMQWTPIDFSPTPLKTGRTPRDQRPIADDIDQREANLESVGGLMKVVGPLIKPYDLPPKYRGFVGIEMETQGSTLAVTRVLGGSPADKAGIEVGDIIDTINSHTVRTINSAQTAMAKTFAGQTAVIVVHRGDAKLTFNIACTEGM